MFVRIDTLDVSSCRPPAQDRVDAIKRNKNILDDPISAVGSMVIDGAQRIEARKQLGLKFVEVFQTTTLD